MKQPLADLSKLKGPLSAAFKIMSKEGDLKPSNRDNNTNINEDYASQEKPLPDFDYKPKSNGIASREQIMQSNLPESIKKSFLDKQIILEQDTSDEDLAKEIIGNNITTQQPKVNERELVGLSEDKIREIVKEEMLKLFSNQVVKNVAEQVVRKVRGKK